MALSPPRKWQLWQGQYNFSIRKGNGGGMRALSFLSFVGLVNIFISFILLLVLWSLLIFLPSPNQRGIPQILASQLQSSMKRYHLHSQKRKIKFHSVFLFTCFAVQINKMFWGNVVHFPLSDSETIISWPFSIMYKYTFEHCSLFYKYIHRTYVNGLNIFLRFSVWCWLFVTFIEI